MISHKQQVNAATGANAATLTHTVGYGYTNGQLTSITYPSGRQLTVTYTAGVPTAISLAKDTSTAGTPLITGIQWQPFGGVKHWDWQLASGSQSNDRTYDTAGRLVRYRLGTTLRDLSYDAADRISSYKHYDATTGAAQTALDQTFSYDELGRLTGITANGSTWSIGYDANGNRTGVTLNGASSSYSISATSNRITGISNPARSFGYDAAGNTTADGNYTATYDTSGRLATLTKAGVTSSFSIDALGRRVRKFDSSGAASTVVFVYGLGGELLGEYDSTGKAIREYAWLGSTPIAVFTPDPASATNPPLVYFIHADHIDTPRLIVDKNNALRWRWLAEPFGTTAPENNPAGLGVFTFNLRFPGQYFDQGTGLNQNWFRDYDASLGRYAQSDPIGLNGGINTYAYVDGNPLSGIDPLGLFTTSADAACTRDPVFCAEIMGAAPKPMVVPPIVVPPIPAAPAPAVPAPSPAPTPQPVPPVVPQPVPLPPASPAGAPMGNNCPEQCDPPEGTICSDFHVNSTPHTTRDIDGNNIGKQPNHVHIWRMNKSPKGCIWNRATALNYTPTNARACRTYPSWVAQHGR